jgi:hypothetical protein
MPFDDPEQDLHFNIKYAVHSFRRAPPPKSRRAETERWKDSLTAHIPIRSLSKTLA